RLLSRQDPLCDQMKNPSPSPLPQGARGIRGEILRCAQDDCGQPRARVRHFAAPPDLMNSDSPTVCGAYPSCSNLPIVIGLPSGMTTCFPIQTALQANRTASSSETAILFPAGMRSMIAACP